MVWSRPPKLSPISGRLWLVSSFASAIATCEPTRKLRRRAAPRDPPAREPCSDEDRPLRPAASAGHAAKSSGAISETIFNVFFKLNFAKIYDGVLATPMGITEIAIGEMMWALMRAALYAVAMFVIMLVFGLILSPWGILTIPAALLVAAAFSAAGLAGTSYLRTVNDFDVPMGLIVMPMFLFSGTFFPVSKLPDPLEWIVQAVPLYHAVEMLRQLTTGAVRPSLVYHLAYLIVAGVAAFAIAMRRLERALIK